VAGVHVRSAEPEDAEAIAALYVLAARQAWPHIFGAANLASLEAPVEALRVRIRSTGSGEQVIVAEVDGEIRGYAIVRPSADADASESTGELDAIYTDPSVWGRGIGRALLASAARLLHERGFAEATLWTAEANERPRAVYAAAGWEPDGAARNRVWRGVRFRELRYRLTRGARS
jgi:GNAT superfamily N-acetyltransferase